jgi:hypothetical protein
MMLEEEGRPESEYGSNNEEHNQAIMKHFKPGSLMHEKNYPKSKFKLLNIPKGVTWPRGLYFL